MQRFAINLFERMKKTLLLLMAVVIASLTFQFEAKSKKGKGQIRFEEYSYDFGIVDEKGGPVSHEFVFYNDGDASIAIREATATCGCTRPEYPQKPIAPGKKGVIKVTYNPLGRPGPIDRMVTVKTTGSPKKVLLKLKGSVVRKNK